MYSAMMASLLCGRAPNCADAGYTLAAGASIRVDVPVQSREHLRAHSQTGPLQDLQLSIAIENKLPGTSMER